jgi:ribokinase
MADVAGATRIDVVVVGSANLDLVATAPRIPGPGETVLGGGYAEHPGGKGLNQAIACSRAGARVAFIAAVGSDPAGTDLTAVAAGEGVDVSGLSIVDLPTGRALITVDERGENSIVVVPGANQSCRFDDLPPATALLAQLEVPLATVLDAFRRAKAIGMLTILNPAPAAPLPDELLELCDVLVPNHHELPLLRSAASVPPAQRSDRVPDRTTEPASPHAAASRAITDADLVAELIARGVGSVVVTHGAGGVSVVAADGTARHQPAFAVTPIDTTGAGDAFCGSLAAMLAAGRGLPAAVRFAAAAGALATTQRGAVPSLPRRAAIETMCHPQPR